MSGNVVDWWESTKVSDSRDCNHPEDKLKKYSHHEESIEIHPGYFRITRVRRSLCGLCNTIIPNKIDLDAVASNRAVGDYYGIHYEWI